jgi:hypothetical protein
LADVGTHVVDLVQWTAFPAQTVDYRRDVHILGARRWPTVISQSDFQRVTSEPEFPNYLAAQVHDGKLDYFCNNSVDYTVRGVKLEILWNWEAPAGTGDSYEAAFHGTRASVGIRQGQAERYVPELYVMPAAGKHAEVLAALQKRVAAWRSQYPGLALNDSADSIHIAIPGRFRVGHEAHFAQVASQFFQYLSSPTSMPAWEKSNMLVKYFVTTKGVESAH